MIIRFPTGLYKNVLPKVESDSTSVTYTISSTDPPRTELQFQQVPTGVERQLRNFPIHTLQTRRAANGDLIYTISKSNYSNVGWGAKQFEVGQVLEFSTVDESTVDPLLVGDTEIRHDTNLLDYDAIGLSSAEQDLIKSSADAQFKELSDELNVLKMSHSDTSILLNTNQKTINEVSKAISALGQLSTDGISSIVAKLNARLTELTVEKNTLIETLNSIAAEASSVSDSLKQLSELVK